MGNKRPGQSGRLLMEQLRRILRAALPLSMFSAGVAWMVVPPTSSQPDGAANVSVAPSSRQFLPYAATGGLGGMDPAAVGGPLLRGPMMMPRASEVSPQTRRAILDTIVAQNTALQKGNLRAALRLATTDFRTGQTLDAFGQMVRTRFPQLLTARRTTCQAMECFEQRYARTLVQVQGSSPGDTALFRYYLMREGGRWRVSSIDPFVSATPGQRIASPARPGPAAQPAPAALPAPSAPSR